MIRITLIGIGTGNPRHLTLQAMDAMNAADLILIPQKGAAKADLAELRRRMVAEVVTNRKTRVAGFDLPVRDENIADYGARVSRWHDAIARAWGDSIATALPQGGNVALLVWGDPALYDSALRIAARLVPPAAISVIPGITAMQALTAAHGIALSDIGEAFTVTTGRRLSDDGFPPGVKSCVVLLDGECAFRTLDPQGVTIWWAAYAGMDGEIKEHGPLSEAGPRIIAARAAARERHGWIMDIYLLRRI
jgi:precorrin-6A synthase